MAAGGAASGGGGVAAGSGEGAGGGAAFIGGAALGGGAGGVVCFLRRRKNSTPTRAATTTTAATAIQRSIEGPELGPGDVAIWIVTGALCSVTPLSEAFTTSVSVPVADPAVNWSLVPVEGDRVPRWVSLRDQV